MLRIGEVGNRSTRAISRREGADDAHISTLIDCIQASQEIRGIYYSSMGGSAAAPHSLCLLSPVASLGFALVLTEAIAATIGALAGARITKTGDIHHIAIFRARLDLGLPGISLVDALLAFVLTFFLTMIGCVRIVAATGDGEGEDNEKGEEAAK